MPNGFRPKPSNAILQRGHPLARGLALAMPFTEGSGGPRDYSGNGNHGTLNGDPQWVNTPWGQGLRFDGTGDEVLTPFPAVGSSDDFAMAFLINPGWTGGFTALPDNTGRAFSIFWDASGDISFTSASDGVFAGAGNKPIGATDGSWWHFLVQRKNGFPEVYLEGVFKFQANNSNTNSASAQDLSFGLNPSGGGSAYDGNIVGIWAYNRALAASEVRELYEDPFALFRPRRTVVPVLAASTTAGGGGGATATRGSLSLMGVGA